MRPYATPHAAATLLGTLFVIANVFGLTGWERRKLLDGPLLILLFVVGVWSLLRRDATSFPPQEC